jgi:hypothetical protein
MSTQHFNDLWSRATFATELAAEQKDPVLLAARDRRVVGEAEGITRMHNWFAQQKYNREQERKQQRKTYKKYFNMRGIKKNKVGNRATGKACIGSSTIMQTPTGTLRLADAKPGDVVMTHLGPQKILSVHDHGFEPSAHYRLTLSNSEEIVLTGDHLVHNAAGKRVCANTLRVGDALLSAPGYSDGVVTVVGIGGVDDIPLTPTVAAGTVVVGGALVSCWAQSEKNAQLMDKVIMTAAEYAKSHSIEETSAFCHRAYEMLKASNKNEEKIEEVVFRATAVAAC